MEIEIYGCDVDNFENDPDVSFRYLDQRIERSGLIGHWEEVLGYKRYRVENGAVVIFWPATGNWSVLGQKRPKREVKLALLRAAVEDVNETVKKAGGSFEENGDKITVFLPGVGR